MKKGIKKRGVIIAVALIFSALFVTAIVKYSERVEASPAFPVIESVTNTSQASATTTHTTNYPAIVDAGDLLITAFVCDDNEAVTFPNEGTDWNTIYNEDAGNAGPTLAIAWRDAVGDEDGTTFDITTGAAEESLAMVIRITGAEDPSTSPPEASLEATGTSIYPDSLSLTPTGGSKEYLWISVSGNDDDDDVTVFPINMGDNEKWSQNAGCTLGMASVEYEGTSFDPENYTIAAPESWEAVTIAVYPVAIANDAPVNLQAQITDLDDTDDLHAQRVNYTLTYNVSDAQGFADIDYAEISIIQTAATRATFRYDEDTDTFTTQAGDAAWELNTALSSASEGGNWVNMTFRFTAEWDAIEEADLELSGYVVDDEPESDTDELQTNYFDVITDLVTSSIEFTDANDPDRVDVSDSVTCDFSVRYVTEPGSGTAGAFYPPDDEFTEISVYDEADATLGTDTTIVNGDGQATGTAKSTVETENYNLYVDMADADYTDAEETLTEQLITDNIEIVSVAFDDSRVDISSSAEVRYVLRYNYDDVQFDGGDGSIVGFTWDGVNTWWDKAVTAPASPSAELYDENDLGALTDSNYGLTVYEDDAGANLIGDRINFRTATFETTDNRINNDTNGEWYCELEYEYDNVEVDDGSVTLNTGTMTWDSGVDHRWEYTFGLGDVGDESRNVASVSGNTEGITALNSAVTSDSETIIYDRIVAYWEQVNDTRENINENVEYRIRAVLDYDDEVIGAADSLSSSWGALTWDGGNSWWEIAHSEASVGSYSITVSSGSEVDYGITLFAENITETTVIYDRIEAYWEQINETDARVNTDVNMQWRIKAVLDYDDEEIGSGDSITSSWGALTWDPGNSWWEIDHTESTVNAYQISLTAGSEVGYGISAFSENITEANGIFDEQQVQTLGANNTNPITGEYVTIWATVQSAYDGHVLGSGDSFTLKDSDSNNYPMTYNGTYWENVTKEDSPVARTVNTYDSVSEVTYDITILDMDGNSVVITWGDVNSVPVNLQASITDMDDTDNVYAQITGNYTLTYNVSDADGFADIDYAEISINQSASIRATFRYDEDTDTFTIQAGDSAWELDIASCSATESGDWVNMTFRFSAEWDATEEASLELTGYVVDDEPESDTDELQTDYFDVVTDLLVSGFAVDDDRGDLSQSLTVSGTVYYADDPGSGTPTTFYPPDDEFTSVDIHKADHTEEGTDSSIVNGAFSASVTAEATVGLETYHAWIDMADADYTDGDESPTDTFISDQIVAYWEQVSDSRDNINDNVEWRIRAVLDYDDEALGSGDTITSSWGVLTWDVVNSWFDRDNSESVVGAYQITLTAGSETGYSISSFSENITETSVIFDRIVAYWEQLNDTRTNINDNIEWRVRAVLDYDDHVLGSGDTLSSNWGALTWDGGNSWWEIAHTESTVGAYSLYPNTGNEADYGITAFTENYTQTSGIYDRIEAYWEQLNDTRTNINDNIEWRIKAVLDYDDEEIGSGDSITSSWGVLTWDPGNSWWEIDHSEASVTGVTITLTAGSEVGYGISEFTENITETTGIYDQIVAYWEDLNETDNRVNTNDNMEWQIKAVLDYDDEEIGSGDSITSSWGALSWDVGNSWWEIAHTESSVSGVTISLTAGSEAGYGISAFSENITETTGIFDEQQVQTLGANNTSPEAGEWVEIYATVQSAYDGHVLGSGDSFTLKDTDTNNYPMTYNGTHWLNETKEDSPVARTINNYDSVSEVTYDITILDMNSLQVVINWGAANNPPVNDQGSITNMDDSDNLYAQFKTYLIDYDGHDDDGYIDIDYVLVNLTQSTTVRASFKYVNSTDTFSQIDGTTGYTIQIGSCSASRSGNNMNLTFAFTVKWGATEEADLELKAFIIDDEPESDTDTLQTDYADAVTDLLVSGFACDDDRGDLSQTLTFSGTVYYADDPASGSPTTFYPPNGEFTSVDIHKASHAEVGADPSIENGAFSASFTSEAIVDITTYHSYIDMADADYSDADENPTDTYISDQIKVYWEQLNETDGRVNINLNMEGRYKAVLDYDESLLGSGDSLSSSWGALSWDGGNTWFELDHTESSVTGVTISGWTGSEVTYSITSITENITETTWIYDRIQIQTLGANNTSPNLDEVVEIYATAQSEYDSHVLGSGDELTLLDSDSNQYVMAYNGSHWIDTRSESTNVVRTVNDYYNVTEDTYSVTILDMNGLSVAITWGAPVTTNIGSPVMFRTDYLTLITALDLKKPRISEIMVNKYALDVSVALLMESGYGPLQINLVMTLYDENETIHRVEDSFYLDVGEEKNTSYAIPMKFTNGLGSTQKTRPDYSLDITAFRVGGEPLKASYAEIPIPIVYGKMRMIPILLVVAFILYEVAVYILSSE